MLLGHQLEEQAPGERHHRPAGDRHRNDQGEVPVVPRRGGARDEEAAAVDEGREEDHTRDSEPVTETACDEGGDHVAGRDGAQQRRRGGLRLMQPVEDVENDERARRCDR